LTNNFSEIRFFFNGLFDHELVDIFNFNSFFILFDNLLNRINTQREWRFSMLTIVRKEHDALENIGFEVRRSSFRQAQTSVY
jgi:hypothetical protein